MHYTTAHLLRHTPCHHPQILNWTNVCRFGRHPLKKGCRQTAEANKAANKQRARFMSNHCTWIQSMHTQMHKRFQNHPNKSLQLVPRLPRGIHLAIQLLIRHQKNSCLYLFLQCKYQSQIYLYMHAYAPVFSSRLLRASNIYDTPRASDRPAKKNQLSPKMQRTSNPLQVLVFANFVFHHWKAMGRESQQAKLSGILCYHPQFWRRPPWNI